MRLESTDLMSSNLGCGSYRNDFGLVPLVPLPCCSFPFTVQGLSCREVLTAWKFYGQLKPCQ